MTPLKTRTLRHRRKKNDTTENMGYTTAHGIIIQIQLYNYQPYQTDDEEWLTTNHQTHYYMTKHTPTPDN